MAAIGRTRPDWLFLLRPKWLCWHAFAVVATVGMLWLGDWQLHRAESGNELSWAYTFEWPLFAVMGVLFWAKSLRDEIRLRVHGPDANAGEPDVMATSANAPAANAPAASGPATAGPISAADRASAGRPAADPATAEAAHLARLRAEVQRHGKWHGWR